MFSLKIEKTFNTLEYLAMNNAQMCAPCARTYPPNTKYALVNDEIFDSGKI